MTPSLLVSSGTVVGPHGLEQADVLVIDGSISAVGAVGTFGGADEVLDATGLLVLPGLVDAHVHVREPGLTHKEDFATASRAAARGGVTTMVVMPHDDPLTVDAETLREKALLGRARSCVDFALTGAVGHSNVDAIAALSEAGAVSVEVMASAYPSALGPVNSWDLVRIMKAARAAGLIVGVFCCDDSIVTGATRDLKQAGYNDMAAHAASWPVLAEEVGVAAVCEMALRSGARVHLRQLSTGSAIELAHQARARGADLTVEVNPHHLVLTCKDAEQAGSRLKVVPPLRSPWEVEALRNAVRRELIDLISSDHAPHARAEKQAERDDVWAVPPGFPGLETMLPLMLDMFGVERVVELACWAPARRFGLPRKGRVWPGFDADLALVDPEDDWVVRAAELESRAGFSPFEGRRFRWRLRHVLVRGQLAVSDCEVVAGSAGRMVSRIPVRDSEFAA